MGNRKIGFFIVVVSWDVDKLQAPASIRDYWSEEHSEKVWLCTGMSDKDSPQHENFSSAKFWKERLEREAIPKGCPITLPHHRPILFNSFSVIILLSFHSCDADHTFKDGPRRAPWMMKRFYSQVDLHKIVL